MARIFYDQAPVQVGIGTTTETLLATDCSINFSSSQQPIYSIGKKGTLGQFPAAARVGDMSFSFLTTITGDFGTIQGAGAQSSQGNIINYLADGIKNSIDSEASGALIKCAGLSGMGFLNSYSFNVASNSISTSSAAFTLFGSGEQLPVSGRLTGVSAAVGGGTASATTGIAHGRYTTMPAGLNTVISAPGAAQETSTIYGADYSISFNHSPIYKIGQEFPTTSFYTTAAESVNITEDLFNSGLKFDETAASYTLQIKGLSEAGNPMYVRLTNAKQVNTSASVGLDDIIRTQKTLTAAY
tara:strand:+ start:1099 stop:1995 length:897 start_codon:yes stop_codon:yes gene_type:complete